MMSSPDPTIEPVRISPGPRWRSVPQKSFGGSMNRSALRAYRSSTCPLMVRYDELGAFAEYGRVQSCAPLVSAGDDSNAHVALRAMDLLGAGCRGGASAASLVARAAGRLVDAGSDGGDDWHRADPEYGSRPTAWLVAQPGHHTDATELRRFCGNRLARYKIPVAFTFVEAMPRNASGKLLREQLGATQGRGATGGFR